MKLIMIIIVIGKTIVKITNYNRIDDDGKTARDSAGRRAVLVVVV